MRESLERSLLTVRAEAEFVQLRATHSILDGFSSAPALLDHLKQRGHDLEETDGIYAALVRALQAGRAARAAQTLLMCGLWPGLDRVYRRRVRYVRGREDELTSAIYAAFTELIAGLDLTRVTRVAATLVRSTARDSRYAFRREVAKHEQSIELLGAERAAPRIATRIRDDGDADADEDQDEDHAYQRVASTDASPDAIASGVAFWRDLIDLRRTLLPVLGADTDLVLRVIVLDERQSSVASDLGIESVAARKRAQRARGQLRLQLRDALVAVNHNK